MTAETENYLIREKLLKMVQYLKNDGYIAKYLGCSEDLVRRTRASLSTPVEDRYVPKPDKPVGFDSVFQKPLADVEGRAGYEDMARYGSRQLLIRMLETGQHTLKNDAFHATVKMIQTERAKRKTAA